MTQYEIWWVRFPPPVNRRPVLLLSRPSTYEYLNKYIAALVTRRARGIPQEVPLGAKEGLAEPCVVTMDNLHTVPREWLERRIGRVASRREPEVKAALGRALGWRELAGAE